MSRSSVGIASETVGGASSFQSFRLRQEPPKGIILPVRKGPDLLDFLAFARN
jgi:hypothetical protein